TTPSVDGSSSSAATTISSISTRRGPSTAPRGAWKRPRPRPPRARRTPSPAPAPRGASSLAYDAVSQRLVLFGGYDGTGYLGDTWVWDGATSQWENVSASVAPPAVTGPVSFTDP